MIVRGGHSVQDVDPPNFLQFNKNFLFKQDWIYRQICESYLPLHPLLPQLVECFVSSIIPKGLKFEQTNQPVTEAEILAVYSDFVTGGNLGTLREDMQANRKRGLKTTRELEKAEEEKSLAPRLLMLYYVLLYQDTLLSVSKSPGDEICVNNIYFLFF